MKVLDCETLIKFSDKFFTISIEFMKKIFKQDIKYPQFISNKDGVYCIYKNSIYANLLFIIPPMKRVKTLLTTIDIDISDVKNYTSIYSIIENDMLNVAYPPSVLQLACGQFDNIVPDKSEDELISGPLFVLDKWKTTSSKEISTVLFNKAIFDTVRNLKKSNSLQSYYFDNSIKDIQNIHQWSGIETDTYQTEVHKANTTVVFPDKLLDMLNNPADQIVTSTIDIASHPSNSQKNKFTINKGIKYVEENKKFRTKIGLPIIDELLRFYESREKYNSEE